MSDELRIEGFDSDVAPRNIYADIVYCIDLTAGMGPAVQVVKEFARSLHENYESMMQSYYAQCIKQLRIKVVGFRDIYCDGAYAFEISDFFSLPEQSAEFRSFVDKLEAKGGGDVPKNSLEALAMAMQSDWCTTNEKTARKRHIVVLFTDAPAHPFEKSITYTGTNYPANMPKSYDELVDLWSGQASFAPGVDFIVDQYAKRLALYVPESCEPWETIAEDFDACSPEYIKPEKGGSDIILCNLIRTLDDKLI